MAAATLTIPNTIRAFMLTSCGPTFKPDLADSVRDKLGSKDCTPQNVIEALKAVKSKADWISFIARPVVLIPLGIALFPAGFAINALGIALPVLAPLFAIMAVALCAMGGGILGYLFDNCILGDFLENFHNAYVQQSELATQWIKTIEVQPNAKIIIQNHGFEKLFK